MRSLKFITDETGNATLQRHATDQLIARCINYTADKKESSLLKRIAGYTISLYLGHALAGGCNNPGLN